ncbi:hypothetical protein GDO81_002922 [Engystomops pustulosus]|uniref:Uncharacterized protein n=1 Tax=Engystomops pustulosus TaxID=76066 RepID=A0AAV7DTB4_ENGPU|nr:hypothetical protein GDO81_002922 [Engystomops pustulosus]
MSPIMHCGTARGCRPVHLATGRILSAALEVSGDVGSLKVTHCLPTISSLFLEESGERPFHPGSRPTSPTCRVPFRKEGGGRDMQHQHSKVYPMYDMTTTISAVIMLETFWRKRRGGGSGWAQAGRRLRP